MVKIWCNDDHSNAFPLSEIGDGELIFKLLQIVDHHHSHTSMFTDETINRMNVLVKSIIIFELKDLLKFIVNEKLTFEMLIRIVPIFYHLQKNIIKESIYFLTQPSLMDMKNLDFRLKIFQLFSEVLKDVEGKNDDIDFVIRQLFPNILIKILFDRFLLIPSYQLKMFIIDLFTKYVIHIPHK